MVVSETRTQVSTYAQQKDTSRENPCVIYFECGKITIISVCLSHGHCYHEALFNVLSDLNAPVKLRCCSKSLYSRQPLTAEELVIMETTFPPHMEGWCEKIFPTQRMHAGKVINLAFAPTAEVLEPWKHCHCHQLPRLERAARAGC